MFLLYSSFLKSCIEIINAACFGSKAQGILMPAFFLPNMSVFFPIIPSGTVPISYQDFYLNWTLGCQISLIVVWRQGEWGSSNLSGLQYSTLYGATWEITGEGRQDGD